MRLFFGLAKDNTDFKFVQEIGFSGVLLENTAKLKEAIQTAVKNGLDIWVKLENTARKDIICLENIGGRATEVDGYIDAFLPGMLDELKSVLGEDIFLRIEGFVVPAPTVSGMIWGEKIENQYQDLPYDLYDIKMAIFDEENSEVIFRADYYERAERYLIDEYFLPVKRYAESLGKKISFDLGKLKIQYDLAKRMINPFRLKEEGISVAIKNEDGKNREAAAILNSYDSGNNNIFLSLGEDCDKVVADIVVSPSLCKYSMKKHGADILLVKPSRDVMMKYIWGENSRRRFETPALISALEGAYYTDMLYEKGFDFVTTDEFGIEKYGNSKKGFFIFCGKKYSHVLICQSCKFLDEGIEILKKAEKDGVLINDSALIEAITAELEE